MCRYQEAAVDMGIDRIEYDIRRAHISYLQNGVCACACVCMCACGRNQTMNVASMMYAFGHSSGLPYTVSPKFGDFL